MLFNDPVYFRNLIFNQHSKGYNFLKDLKKTNGVYDFS